ncbi:hypothetical protein RUND412_010195 [Rhizina undulata]
MAGQMHGTRSIEEEVEEDVDSQSLADKYNSFVSDDEPEAVTTPDSELGLSFSDISLTPSLIAS